MERKQYHLYIITDHTWLGDQTLEQDTERALRGGATLVQIREKQIDDAVYIARARAVKSVCDRFDVPMIINDNVAVAKAVGAAGVHLGESDGSIREARILLGEGAIIGATTNTVEAARRAEQAGADYIGCGAVFGTTTKEDAKKIPLEQLCAVVAAVSIPVVAIGGIHAENAMELRGCGVAGLCAISSVYGQADVEQAARRLRAVADEVCV